jgi:hypothetical protein
MKIALVNRYLSAFSMVLCEKILNREVLLADDWIESRPGTEKAKSLAAPFTNWSRAAQNTARPQFLQVEIRRGDLGCY